MFTKAVRFVLALGKTFFLKNLVLPVVFTFVFSIRKNKNKSYSLVENDILTWTLTLLYIQIRDLISNKIKHGSLNILNTAGL